MDLKKMCYSLHCFYCAQKFSLGSWMDFAKHVYQQHLSLLQEAANSDDFRSAVDEAEEIPDPIVVNVDELTEEPDVPCERCGAVFPGEAKLQEHKKVDHLISEFAFQCDTCHWLYTNVRSITAHEATHYEFYCKLCRKHFNTDDDLLADTEKHKINAQRAYCDICQKKFNSHYKYRAHIRRIHNHPTYTCHLCGKVYHKRGLFVSHIKVHKNQRDYVCDQCGKSFVRARNLKSHEVSHTDGPKLRVACTICQRKFSGYHPLMTHKKEAHFVLEGTIEQLEAMVPAVKQRKKIEKIIDPVDNKKRLVCEICGKIYRQYYSLHCHKKREHSLQPRSYSRRKIATVEKTAATDIEDTSIYNEIVYFEPEDAEILRFLGSDDEEDKSVAIGMF